MVFEVPSSGAVEGSRTPTSKWTLDPEPSASTNSATLVENILALGLEPRTREGTDFKSAVFTNFTKRANKKQCII